MPWRSTFPNWDLVGSDGLSLEIKFNRLPWVPGTEANNPEVELGPRADTGGCSACKSTEKDAWEAYLTAYINCGLQSDEDEIKNCRRLAWIFYLDAVYDCFSQQGCFGVDH